MIELAAIQEYIYYLTILEENNQKDTEHDEAMLDKMDILWYSFTREEIEYIEKVAFAFKCLYGPIGKDRI